MVVNTDISQGQVEQKDLALDHHRTNGVTWLFYRFIYQVAQKYIVVATYHINGVKIAYSVICIR